MNRFAALVVILLPLAGGCQKSDKQLAQGEWVIASIESSDERQDVDTERVKELVLAVQGNRMRVTHATEKFQVSGLFTLDPTKTPKELNVPEVFLMHDGKEETLRAPGRGIYKFEGDELVIALTLGDLKDPARPTEFKPSASADGRQKVLVFHLKRK
jgi:uncharacterized protein (TIGR03067 family)